MFRRELKSLVIYGRLCWRQPDGPDWRHCMTLPVSSPFAPMETLSVLEIRVATNGSTNRNGTVFVVWFQRMKLKTSRHQDDSCSTPRIVKNRPAYVDEPASATQY